MARGHFVERLEDAQAARVEIALHLAGARLTISVGAAVAKELSGEPQVLMAFADKLLYAAKAAGRNQVKIGQLGADNSVVRAA